ncbi:MAG: flagellar basal body P-ring formation chaperone FlgA [Pseudomonadota bacterium]
MGRLSVSALRLRPFTLAAACLLATAAVLSFTVPPSQAEAGETLRAARLLSPGEILEAEDLIAEAAVPGESSDEQHRRLRPLLGMRLRQAVPAGGVIGPEDVTLPPLVKRNTRVTLQVTAGGLRLLAEGRALDEAPLGGTVPVINLSTRRQVSGIVVGPGRVEVGR